MRQFAAKGFRLASSNTDLKLTYALFLTFTFFGLVTLAALSLGRVGFSPEAIATYYRGSDTEMKVPKEFWQLMEVSHFHLFSEPTVILILTHLAFATGLVKKHRVLLTLGAYGGSALEISGPWLVRYVGAWCSYLLLAGWLLLLLCGGALFLISLISILLPRPMPAPEAAP
jgi:hypothetical protein